MATADDLLTEVYRRTRDPVRSSTPENLGLDLLSFSQQVVNISVKSELKPLTFTLAPSRLLYRISTEIPDCARMEAIRIGTQDLTELPDWRDLFHIDHLWFRRIVPSIGTQRVHWAKIGRDMFVVYPGPTVATDVTLVYTPYLADLALTTDTISIRNEFFPLLLDLTEALFLFRLRLPDPLKEVITRLNIAMGIKA